MRFWFLATIDPYLIPDVFFPPLLCNNERNLSWTKKLIFFHFYEFLQKIFFNNFFLTLQKPKKNKNVSKLSFFTNKATRPKKKKICYTRLRDVKLCRTIFFLPATGQSNSMLQSQKICEDIRIFSRETSFGDWMRECESNSVQKMHS